MKGIDYNDSKKHNVGKFACPSSDDYCDSATCSDAKGNFGLHI